MDTNGKITKNVVLQWGELPTSVGEHWVVGSIPHGGPIELFLFFLFFSFFFFLFFCQCSTTGVTKTVVCTVLSVGTVLGH